VRVPRHSSPRRDRATAAAPRPGGRRTGTRRLRALARRAAEPHSMLLTATPQSWHSAPGPRGRRARAVLVSSRSAETLHHRSAGAGIMGAVRTTTCSNFKPQQPSLGDSGGLRAPTLSAPAGSPTGARRATGREPRRPASAGPAFERGGERTPAAGYSASPGQDARRPRPWKSRGPATGSRCPHAFVHPYYATLGCRETRAVLVTGPSSGRGGG
jgi:hypothetical protein